MVTMVRSRWSTGIFYITAIITIAACVPSPAGQLGLRSPSPEATVTASIPPHSFTPTGTKYPTRTKPYTPTITPTITPLDDASIVLPGWVPEGARARLGKGFINQIALSPDGKTVAVAGTTGLFLYRTEDFSVLWSVPTAKAISEVVFSADGSTLAAAVHCIFYPHRTIEGGAGPMCSDQVDILIFHTADGSLLNRIVPYPGDHTFGGSQLVEIALSSDGTTLYLATHYEEPSSWDTVSGQKLRNYQVSNPRYQYYYYGFAFSADGTRMGVALEDGNVYIVDLEGGEAIRSLKVASDFRRAVKLTFSPDADRIAVATGTSITIWNIFNARIELPLEGSTADIARLVFSPDGERLVSGDVLGNLNQWNAADGHFQRFYPETEGVFHSMGFLADGRTLLAGTATRILSYNVVSGQAIPVPEMPFSGWKNARWTAEGKEFVLQTDGIIQYWNAEDLAFSRSVGYPKGAVLSPDYRMYAEAAAGNMILISYLPSGKQILRMEAPDYLRSESGFAAVNPDNVNFSPDGKTLATVANQWQVLLNAADLWDFPSGARRYRLTGKDLNDGRSTTVFSDDGSLVALGVYDGTGEYGEFITVFQTSTGEKINLFMESLESIFEFSADGNTLLTGCDPHEGPGSICLYDVYNGSRHLAYLCDFYPAYGRWGGSNITGLSMSPDGSLVAAGTIWGDILILDGAQDRLIRMFGGHTLPVRSLAFSPDGSTLASISDDGTVIVWDLE
jgi:WD40 repeat protein